jgi:hypothetical protein
MPIYLNSYAVSLNPKAEAVYRPCRSCTSGRDRIWRCRTFRRLAWLLVLPVLLAGWSSGQALAEGVALAPHRAVYELELDGSDTSGMLAAFNGRLVIDITGSVCEGYAINTRYVYRRRASDGDEVLTDLRTSQFEGAGAEEFRFSHRRFDNDKLVQQSEGSVAREEGGIDISLVKPSERQVSVKKPVMFPNQHVMELLNAAMKGERKLSATIYDGSKDADELIDTFAVLGSRNAPGEGDGGESPEGVGDMANWPISIGYFDGGLIDTAAGKEEQTPLYTMSFKLFENGVSDQIRIDYGTFVLEGALVELELRDAPPCD